MNAKIKPFTLTASLGMAICFAFLASGCADKTPPEPKNYKERAQAIDNNPSFSPEQKEKYKQQLAESEKAAEMGKKLFRDSKPPSAPGQKSPSGPKSP